MWDPVCVLGGVCTGGLGRGSHRGQVGLLVEGLPEDSHDKEVDDEGDTESEGGLCQEVHVGFPDGHKAGPVYLPGL